MKQLVILCHPKNEKLNEMIWSDLLQVYNKYKLDFEVRDLYKMEFNPILSVEDITAAQQSAPLKDVRKEQELINDSEYLTFIYPIWATGMPALLKGYIDRVFSEGFAYSFTDTGGVKKLLKGKKVVLVNTLDQGSNLYKNIPISSLIAVEKHLFESFGMEVVLQFFLETAGCEDNPDLLKTKMEDLKLEVKKVMALSRNSRLSIPTAFF